MKPNPIQLAAIWLMLLIIDAPASVHYVDLNCTNPTAPYASWDMASTNIQSAINIAIAGDLVLVTNGVYTNGNSFYMADNSPPINIFSVVKIPAGILVSSVNGSAHTSIQGRAGYNCACLLGNAGLNGFTLTNGITGVTTGLGGGAYCSSTNATISNCYICSNTAYLGGGVFLGTLTDCILANNTAKYENVGAGGGSLGSILNHCTLAGNSAYAGGGVAGDNTRLFTGQFHPAFVNDCILINNTVLTNNTSLPLQQGGSAAYAVTINNSLIASNSAWAGCGYSNIMNNCVIAYNTASSGSNYCFSGCVFTNCTLCYTAGNPFANACSFRNSIIFSNQVDWSNSDFQNCCFAKNPVGPGVANSIIAMPGFVNDATDFHLQSNSPCINSGNNAYASTTTDLDENTRIAGGTVDIGAYEYQTPASVLSYDWLEQYGLPIDGSADFVDTDGDGMSNYAEWRAGTIPTNGSSVLKLSPPVFTNSPTGLAISWQSVTNATYYLQRSTNLTTFSGIQSNLLGQADTTSFIDTTATNAGPYYYRIGVQ